MRTVDMRGERGFSLIEVVFAAALVTLVIAGSVGAFAAIAKRGTPERMRDIAASVAQNTLVRARAASAYAPNPLPVTSADALGTYLHSRSWALALGRQTATVAAKIISPGAICGQSHALSVPLTVTTEYAEPGSPPVPSFTVTVAYPDNPCAPAATSTLTMSEELPAVAFAPGTRVTRDLVNPPWGQ